MAIFVGRDAAKGCWSDRWAAEVDEKDPLYKTTNQTKLATLLSMESQQDLARKLLWEAASKADQVENVIVPQLMLPPIQIDGFFNTSLPSTFISPCSEPLSPCPSGPETLSPFTRVSVSPTVNHLWHFEHEDELRDEQVFLTAQETASEQATDKDDAEGRKGQWVQCDVNNRHFVLSSPANQVLESPLSANDRAEEIDINAMPANDSICDKEDLRSCTTSTPRSSPLSKNSILSSLRRQKARTYSGARCAGRPIGLSIATLRARACSLSRLRNQSVDNENNGDFSSDDEGYTPELHCHRASDTSRASQWRQARNSMSTKHRLNVRMMKSSSMMSKRLQEAKCKVNSGFSLTRSCSIGSTVTSDKSGLDSPALKGIKSILSGQHHEPNTVRTCSVDNVTTTLPPARNQHLRASVLKAARLVNGASAEAARKLRSRGFRTSHMTRLNPASETDGE